MLDLQVLSSDRIYGSDSVGAAEPSHNLQALMRMFHNSKLGLPLAGIAYTKLVARQLESLTAV